MMKYFHTPNYNKTSTSILFRSKKNDDGISTIFSIFSSIIGSFGTAKDIFSHSHFTQLQVMNSNQFKFIEFPHSSLQNNSVKSVK